MGKLCLIFKDRVKSFKAAEMTFDLTDLDGSKGCALHLESSEMLHCLSNPRTECNSLCSLQWELQVFSILADLNMQNM